MSIGSFYDHQVTGLDSLPGGIYVYSLAGVLEAYLEKILVLLLGNTLQPIVRFKLAASLTVVAVILSRLLVADNGTSAVAVELNGLVVCVVHHSFQ